MSQGERGASLTAIFLARWPGRASEAPPALEEILAGLCEEARAAWPDLGLRPEDFVGWLAERVPADAELGTELPRLHASDLFLARACLARNEAAASALHARYLTRIGFFLRRMKHAKSLVEEVREELSEELLGRGTLANYQGRGPLEEWMRVAAIRTALNLRRGDGRRQRTAQRAAAATPLTPDPELEVFRHRYRADFEAALREAMGAISAEHRSLLKMRFLDRLGSSEIASIHGVHRATVARWLDAAQEAVLAETRRRLPSASISARPSSTAWWPCCEVRSRSRFTPSCARCAERAVPLGSRNGGVSRQRRNPRPAPGATRARGPRRRGAPPRRLLALPPARRRGDPGDGPRGHASARRR
jgi:RNA polymerase sigma-70 factor (ECF subfamily)